MRVLVPAVTGMAVGEAEIAFDRIRRPSARVVPGVCCR